MKSFKTFSWWLLFFITLAVLSFFIAEVNTLTPWTQIGLTLSIFATVSQLFRVLLSSHIPHQ